MAESKDRGVILTSFHQRFFPSIFHMSKMGFAIMISPSHDGEIVARLAKGLGAIPLRGATGKSGAKVLLQAISMLKEGKSFGHMVDGPLGPAFKVQPGVIYMSQKSGIPIVPVAISMKKYWQFNSWDKFRIPKFFSPILMVFGSPIFFDQGMNITEAVEKLQKIKIESLAEADKFWSLSKTGKETFLNK